jgi:uncharacterized protein (DUF1786 family)
MAVLYIYESDQADLGLYDRLNSQIQEVPEGALCHVACKRDGGGLFVVEVWESEEQQDRWNAFIQQKIQDAGGPGRPTPRKMEVHNMRFASESAGARH